MLASAARAADGDTFTYEGLYFTIISEALHTAEVSGNYNKVTSEISIPSEAVNGSSAYTVTRIGNWAFEHSYNLTSVTIPNSVTSIGEHAFAGSGLTSVTIPNSVTSICNGAFASCCSLISVIISKSITTISEDTFFNCSSLKSVTIPNSVTAIGNSAFGDCSNLKSVTLPNSVTTIGAETFSGCSGLKSVIMRPSVTTIGDYAFVHCSSLKEITIPKSLTSIGHLPFLYCKSLTKIFVETGNQKFMSINGVVFSADKTKLVIYPCGKMGEYIIPNSVTEIGNYAFYYCKGLESVTIPNSVTSVGEYAFTSSGLTSVNIPASVTSIGKSAFICAGLWKFYVDDGNPNFTSEDGVLFNVDKTKLIQFPCGQGRSSYTIPQSVTEIEDHAFESCAYLISVTIPNSVTSIGERAFSFCRWLTSVSIPNSVTEIKAQTFYGCRDLTSVTIPNSVTSIGDEAFSSCEMLTSVTIPESATSIGRYAFYSCYHLTSVSIPASVTSIGKSAFENCFVICSGPTKAVFASIESLCKIKFEGATANPLYHAHNLWIGGEEVKNLIIPNSLTSIGPTVFARCKNLTSVAIPASVTSIGDNAFSDCENLKTLYTLNPTPPTIGRNYGWGAFSGVPQDAAVYIPAGSVDAYRAAEGWNYFSDFREITAGIDDVAADVASKVDVFNLSGVSVLRNADADVVNTLTAGIYIIRRGTHTRKIIVK